MATFLFRVVREYVAGDKLTPHLPRALRLKALMVGVVLGLWMSIAVDRILG